ncbi:MAG: hypothetical protein M1828_000395 [Chrysothrix sp. TS-e1954]|nr:MAG: hypothetical protein M1828_000395 [Chrysothrix sp. TS-e1954]
MSGIYTRIQDTGYAARDRGMTFLDSRIPPERRSELSDSLRQWILVNPKLAAFLAFNLALSGPPVLLFSIFTLTVLTTSLLVCTVTALIVALSFTALCVTGALVVLVPTLLLTTLAASFFFFWGLVAYLLANRFQNDPRTEGIRTTAYETAQSVGQKANDLSDGRLELALADSKDRQQAIEVARTTSLSNSSMDKDYRVASAAAMGARDGKPTKRGGESRRIVQGDAPAEIYGMAPTNGRAALSSNERMVAEREALY